MLSINDPLSYNDRLESMPKFIAVTSDDEFMMFDWTNLYYDKLKGEKNLLIVPNAEHSMATGIVGVLSACGAFTRSIASNHTSRPTYTYEFNKDNGMITVKIPKTGPKLLGVYLRHGETF